MALIVETGAGVEGANSYATQAFITAYWAARPHNALATTWAAAGSGDMDGAAIEATAYLDAMFGAFYRGVRAGFVQGLLFPRTGAVDDQGFPLPDLPQELPQAVAELAGRSLTKRLMPDTTIKGVITKKASKAGPVSTATEYGDGAVQMPTFGYVDKLLGPVLNGAQGGVPSWHWR